MNKIFYIFAGMKQQNGDITQAIKIIIRFIIILGISTLILDTIAKIATQQ